MIMLLYRNMNLIKQEAGFILNLENDFVATLSIDWVNEVAEVLIGSKNTQLIIDLSDVTFIDSQGLRFFLVLKKRLAGQGIEIILSKPNERLLRLFQLMGLDQLFVFRHEESLE